MNKLTVEKCRELVKQLRASRDVFGPLPEKEDYKLQALEIALPILEQRERANKATLTDEKREWLIDECKADMQRYTSNSPRYLVAQIALASLEACCIIPEQPTNQNGEQ